MSDTPTSDAERIERIEQRRHLNASLERVWNAWADASTIARWFTCGPGYRTEFRDWRIAIGQQFAITYFPLPGTDDVVRTIEGEFLEVDEPYGFAYRWNEHSKVTIEFSRAGDGGTDLHLVMVGPMDDAFLELQTGGWTYVLDSFVANGVPDAGQLAARR